MRRRLLRSLQSKCARVENIQVSQLGFLIYTIALGLTSCRAASRMPGCRDHSHARTAGVRKAPRHEIAGCGALMVRRALWGLGVRRPAAKPPTPPPPKPTH